ncbi:hypothetical protein [Bradyrhizobium sp. LMG 9283]|uniref:hypothetical protein n=1 Tax=Bradyrhizobium sp. LMG 9283 TaxID=592064 RepID=UPI00388E90AB
MSDATSEQLRPPPSWDKFEEIRADLFRALEGQSTVRYGRRGKDNAASTSMARIAELARPFSANGTR